MVLDADVWTVELDGELRREVLRMEVMGDEVGDHTVQRRQVFDRLEERGVRGDVSEVADVMTGDYVGALGHRQPVFFSSAPTARTATDEASNGNRIGSGA